MTAAPRPLDGIRVLDFTRYIPGPYGTLLLASMGADVVKVEPPAFGDPMRRLALDDDGGARAHEWLNRGKRSVAIDLRSEEGASALKRLAAQADVLVEGFRPGVLARRGLGAEALQAANPRLVYCSLTGYGPLGPLADHAGHDVNYIGLGGLLALNRGPEGPVLPRVQLADMTGGLLAALAVLAALHARERTGRGQVVDVSLLDGVRALMAVPAARGLGRAGRPDALGGDYACYNVYRCRDGRHVSVGALETKFWDALCAALDLPAGAREQWPQTEERRRAGIEAVSAAFGSRDRDDWVRVLAPADACVEPVLDLDESVGRFGPPDVPFGLQDTPLRTGDRAPALGEHTAEVLR
ncbi:MAG TPA: CaiB/BaiF CoA-transferase family protein [Vicinamibacteria bacterium]